MFETWCSTVRSLRVKDPRRRFDLSSATNRRTSISRITGHEARQHASWGSVPDALARSWSNESLRDVGIWCYRGRLKRVLAILIGIVRDDVYGHGHALQFISEPRVVEDVARPQLFALPRRPGDVGFQGVLCSLPIDPVVRHPEEVQARKLEVVFKQRYESPVCAPQSGRGEGQTLAQAVPAHELVHL